MIDRGLSPGMLKPRVLHAILADLLDQSLIATGNTESSSSPSQPPLAGSDSGAQQPPFALLLNASDGSLLGFHQFASSSSSSSLKYNLLANKQKYAAIAATIWLTQTRNSRIIQSAINNGSSNNNGNDSFNGAAMDNTGAYGQPAAMQPPPQTSSIPSSQAAYQFGYAAPNSFQQQQQIMPLYNTLPPALYQQIWHLPPNLQQQYIAEYHKQLQNSLVTGVNGGVGSFAASSFSATSQQTVSSQNTLPPVVQWGWQQQQQHHHNQQQQQQQLDQQRQYLQQLTPPQQITDPVTSVGGGTAAAAATRISAGSSMRLLWSIVEQPGEGSGSMIFYSIVDMEMVLVFGHGSQANFTVPTGRLMRNMKGAGQRLQSSLPLSKQ